MAPLHPSLEGVGTQWACGQESGQHPAFFYTKPDKITPDILNLYGRTNKCVNDN